MTCKVRTSADPVMVYLGTWFCELQRNRDWDVSCSEKKFEDFQDNSGQDHLLCATVVCWVVTLSFGSPAICRHNSCADCRATYCFIVASWAENAIGFLYTNQSKAAAFGQECCLCLCYSVLLSFWNSLKRLSICIGFELQLFWLQAIRLGSNDVPGFFCAGGKSKGGKAGCRKLMQIDLAVNSTAYFCML